MATHSFIAQKLPSGSFRAVYCHWDGYPENNGVILHSHYFNTPMVEELLALGSLSSLGERANPTLSTHSYDKPQDDVTVAYHRDRGEDLRPASEYADLAALKAACSEAGGEFLYIWDGASWSVDGKPLADVLAEANLLPETDLFPAQPEPAPAGPDWAVLGPRLAAALKGAQKAMREALPMVSADEGHNGVAVFVGEWLDEVNEVVALLPA